MNIIHLGGENTVTGSCHLLTASGLNIMVDCGLAQGNDSILPMESWPMSPSEVDYLFLTHAHIDHIGRVPELIEKGFSGEIICSHPTKALLIPMLQDAMGFSDRPEKKVDNLLRAIDDLSWGFEYREKFQLKKGIKFRLGCAGHILGSCWIQFDISDQMTVVFSGDLGAKDTPILCDPDVPDGCDLLILESTYGDKNHEERGDRIKRLGEILLRAITDGGKVFIPAFSLGRTQELIYEMDRLFSDPQITPVRFSEPTGQAQINADYEKELAAKRHPSTIFRTYPSEISSPKLHGAGGVNISRKNNGLATKLRSASYARQADPPQYDLPDLPMYHLPELQGRRGRHGHTRTENFHARKIEEIEDQKAEFNIPVFIDSPLGLEITKIYSGLSEYWDKEAKHILRQGDHPINFDHLYAVESHRDHLKLCDMDGEAVIIAGSGMCTGGRILKHLKAGITDRKNDVFFVGYQAKGTPGRDILKYSKRPGGYVVLDGEKFDINARVHQLTGYSAHADQKGLIEWVASMPEKPGRIKLVHGEAVAREALYRELGKRFNAGCGTSLSN